MQGLRTNDGGNVFMSAREEAAKRSERFQTKSSASEALGMDRSRLSRIELDIINPYPEEVKLMSAEYKCPELRAYYCRNICPLGRDVPEPDAESIDRITVRAMSKIAKLKEAKKTLLEITADGKIEGSDIAELNKVIEALDAVSGVAADLRMWVEKNIE